MPERNCQLSTGLHWENRSQIPQQCLDTCGDLFENIATMQMYGEYDVFPEYAEGYCDHDNYSLETEDVSLQRGEGAERVFSVTDSCANCGHEHGAQSYRFTCRAE